MNRTFALAYALVAYLAFFLVFLWFVAFVGDIRSVGNLVTVPTTVDQARLVLPPATAAILDIALIALFGFHHSAAARMGFKERLTRSVPKSVERATYVLVASVILAALMWFWAPIPATVWDISGGALSPLLWGLFAIGWVILFTSTLLLNHFELFGLQQAWNHGAADPPPQMFRTPLFYKLVRHPLYLGFVIALWATPQMTVGHLLLAAGLTIYIFVGIHYEERDLVGHYGAQYEDYRRKVGTIIPGIGRRST